MEIQYTSNTPLLTYYEYWKKSPDGIVYGRNKNPFPSKTLHSSIFSKSIGEISREDIEAYLKTEFNNGLSLGSVRRYQNFFNRIFRKAVVDGALVKNPCESLRCLQPPPPEHRVFSHQEMEALMKYLKYRHEGNLFLLIRYTGIYNMEARELKWMDVDFKKKELHIRKPNVADIFSEFEKYKKCRVLRGSERVIPLSREALEVLEDEKEWQKKRLSALSGLSSPIENADDYVNLPIFTDNYGKPYTSDDFQHMNRRVQKETGILDFGSDRLRIHFALELLQAGVDLKTMSTITGLQANKTVFNYFSSNERLERMKNRETL